MASIVDRLKKQIKSQEGDTKGVQTIPQAIKRLDLDGIDEDFNDKYTEIRYEPSTETVFFESKETLSHKK